jgi:hypothetical protein
VNPTLCDDSAACQRNCDRHAEEETRAKTKKKNIVKDELRQKEHQNARCTTGGGSCGGWDGDVSSPRCSKTRVTAPKTLKSGVSVEVRESSMKTEVFGVVIVGCNCIKEANNRREKAS